MPLHYLFIMLLLNTCHALLYSQEAIIIMTPEKNFTISSQYGIDLSKCNYKRFSTRAGSELSKKIGTTFLGVQVNMDPHVVRTFLETLQNIHKHKQLTYHRTICEVGKTIFEYNLSPETNYQLLSLHSLLHDTIKNIFTESVLCSCAGRTMDDESFVLNKKILEQISTNNKFHKCYSRYLSLFSHQKDDAPYDFSFSIKELLDFEKPCYNYNSEAYAITLSNQKIGNIDGIEELPIALEALSLDISHNKLHVLTSSLSWLCSLRELDISNNYLASDSLEPLNDLEHLQRVDMRRNLLTKIDKNFLKKAHNLTELNLDNNCIKKISKKALAQAQELQELSLNNNPINKLPNNFLSTFKKLIVFNCAQSRLTEISEVELADLKHLYALNIEKNCLPSETTNKIASSLGNHVIVNL